MVTKNILLLLLFVPILLFGQKLSKPELQQNTHQLLVINSYQLLKYEIPEMDNTDMDDHVGAYENNGPWTTPKIAVGAYREDEEDIVYGIGGTFNGWDPSSTHFWDVDGGDDSKIYVFPNYIENAYQKARVLVYGLDVWGNKRIFLYQSGDWPEVGAYNTIGWYMSYDNIFDLYNTGKYYWEGYVDANGTSHYYHFGPYYMSVGSRQYYVWEILGRAAHLLGDMGVPAHVHNDLHPISDSYEDAMTTSYASQWDYLDAYNQGGTIDVINKYDPLRYLFYTVSQVADHFPSDDYPGSNDYTLNYGTDQYLELQGILANLGSPPGSVIFNNIANTSYVTSMRAISGLLYWFAVETGMITERIRVPGNYSTIQAALSAATSGQTIIVNGAQNVSNNLSVQSGIKLQINPGAIITFNSSKKISVYGGGVLNANGATFKGNGTAGNWNSISFLANSNGSIQNSTIKDAQCGIYATTNTNVTVSNNTITNNSVYGLSILSNSDVTVSDNTISNNGTGINISTSDVTISGNTIEDNTNYGINAANVGSSLEWDNNTMHGNGYAMFLNNASPYIYDNTISENDHGITISSSDPSFSDPNDTEMRGYNAVTCNTATPNFKAENYSTVYAGYGYDGGYNSIFGSELPDMEAKTHSGIYACNNYWGPYSPAISADGTSWILA